MLIYIFIGSSQNISDQRFEIDIACFAVKAGAGGDEITCLGDDSDVATCLNINADITDDGGGFFLDTFLTAKETALSGGDTGGGVDVLGGS